MPLLSHLIRNRLAITLAAAFTSVLTAAIALWWNTVLAGIINTVSVGHLLQLETIVLALVIMLFMGVSTYVKAYVSGYACELLAHDLRMGYARHFANLKVIEIESLNAGEQLSRLQNEIADVSAYLNANLFQLADDAIRFIITLIWLCFINPFLTMSVNLPVVLIMVYVFFSSRIIGKASALSQQAKGQMNRYADTLLTAFPVIRLYDAARMVIDGYTKEVSSWEHNTVHSERTRARLMSLSGLLSSLPLALLLLIGGSMAINGTLAVGTLYVFINLSGNVSGIMMNMPGYIAAFRQFAANMKRLEGKIDSPAKRPVNIVN